MNVRDIVIVDIDGTIAFHLPRLMIAKEEIGLQNLDPKLYDWAKFSSESLNDPPIVGCINIVRTLSRRLGMKIFIFTARHESSRDVTTEWLLRHDVPYNRLVMRPDGNNEEDFCLKERWLFEYLHPDQVFCAIEDRPSVIKMFLSHDVPVIQFHVPDPSI